MNRAGQNAARRQGHSSQPTPTSSPQPARRRVRRRRYHVPREALGLGYYREPVTAISEIGDLPPPPKALGEQVSGVPATPAPAVASRIAEAEFRLEEERKLRLTRRALRMWIALLLLIVFRNKIVWLLDQAVTAWPFMNGY